MSEALNQTNIADTDNRTHRQLIVLGASNVTMGWKYLTDVAVRRGYSVIHVAAGMGRSYIRRSRFAWRSLPAIRTCGLWESLQTSADTLCATDVLLTDLGNDLVYGFSPSEIVSAASACIEQLRALHPDCTITVTRPPTDSLRRLSELRFALFRAILFPFSGIRLDPIRRSAEQLDELTQQLCTDLQLTCHQPDSDWYAFDPIHVRRSSRSDAFERFIPQPDTPVKPIGAGNEVTWLKRRPTPAERTLLGRTQVVPQPSLEAAGISVYAW